MRLSKIFVTAGLVAATLAVGKAEARLITYDFTVAYNGNNAGNLPAALLTGTGSGTITINSSAPVLANALPNQLDYLDAYSAVSFTTSTGISVSGHSDAIYADDFNAPGSGGLSNIGVFGSGHSFGGSSPAPNQDIVPSNFLFSFVSPKLHGQAMQLADLPPLTFADIDPSTAVSVAFTDPFKEGDQLSFDLTSLTLVSDVDAVPEPGSLVMLITALGGLLWMRRRERGDARH